MSTIKTGNAIVDAMAEIQLTGNIVPNNWYRWITKPNHKPYLLAIVILSEFAYWYRPSEVRDENTGQTIKMEKRFKADLLQKSYDQLSERFGEEKKTIKRAVDHLEHMGVIRREFRTVCGAYGRRINNVMYIAVIPEAIRHITYDEPPVDTQEDFRLTDLSGDREQNREQTVSQYVRTNTNKSLPENTTKNTTTEQIVVDLHELGLNDKESDAVLAAAANDINKVSLAVQMLRSQKKTIRNATGWLISAVTGEYKHIQVGQPEKTGLGHFVNERTYNIDQIEKELVNQYKQKEE